MRNISEKEAGNYFLSHAVFFHIFVADSKILILIEELHLKSLVGNLFLFLVARALFPKHLKSFSKII